MNNKRKSKKPYMPGQQPCQCGHFYPDVIRLYDEVAPFDEIGTHIGIRVLHCDYCGIIKIPIDIFDIIKIPIDSFDFNGLSKDTTEEEIQAIKEQERKRLRKLKDSIEANS